MKKVARFVVEGEPLTSARGAAISLLPWRGWFTWIAELRATPKLPFAWLRAHRHIATILSLCVVNTNWKCSYLKSDNDASVGFKFLWANRFVFTWFAFDLRRFCFRGFLSCDSFADDCSGFFLLTSPWVSSLLSLIYVWLEFLRKLYIQNKNRNRSKHKSSHFSEENS